MKYLLTWWHELAVLIAGVWAAIGTAGQNGLINWAATEVSHYHKIAAFIAVASIVVARLRDAPTIPGDSTLAKKAGLSVIAILTLGLVGIGCKDAYGTAAKLAQDIAVSVNQADITIDQFRIEGTISPSEEYTILGYLDSLNTLDGQYLNCVKVAHTAATKIASFTACANALSVAIGDPNTLYALHISNPAKQAEVTAVVTGIKTLVVTTVTALGGK